MKKTVAALTAAIMCFGTMAVMTSAEEIYDTVDTVDAVVTSDDTETYEDTEEYVELDDEEQLTANEEKLMLIEQGLNAAIDASQEKADFTEGEYACKNNSDGSVTIVRHTGNSVNITIPSKIKGKTVTAIGKYAFYGDKVKSVVIPDTVVTIGDHAFIACFELESVKIGSKVTTMKNSIFFGCKNLKSVSVPDSVKNFDILMFTNCESLTSVKLPKGLKEIPFGTFEGCKKLPSVTIPSGVTEIGATAFCKCDSLKSLTIPAGVTKVGTLGFGTTYDKNSKKVLVSGFTAYVAKGSAAETYCKNNKITYKYGTARGNGGSGNGGSGNGGSGNGGSGNSGNSGKKFMKGDATGDAKIDVSDIAVIATHIKGIKALNSNGFNAGNVNGDKNLTVTDIAVIASHIRGIKAIK